MATQRNFEIKNGLTIAGTERISSAGAFSGSLASATTATTQSATDNSTKIATTAYTDAAITALVDSSPGTLNTLNELAAALNDDAAFSTTVTNSIATKAPLASPSFTGNADVAGELYVGTQNSVFAENVLRFNSAGASYIDHTTTGQSIRFRVSNSSALDTTPLILHSNGNAVFSGGIEAGTAGISTQDHRMPAGAGYITYSPANGSSDTLTIRKHGVTQQLFNASGVSFPSGNITTAGAINDITLSTGGIAGNTAANFALNTPHSVRINIDSNNSATGESFIVGNNQTAVNQSNVLFKVQENGSVGIGTSSPRYNLTVAGNSTTAIGIGVDNASGSSTLDIAALGTGYNNHQAGAGEVWFFSPDNINIGGATGHTNDIKFLANNSVNMIIKGANGNVGIGTESPLAKLHVVSGPVVVSPGTSSHNGAYHIIGSVANYSTANGRYIHAQLSTVQNNMFHIIMEGYTYTTGQRYGRCSGYVYNYAGGGNAATGSFGGPGVYDGRVSGNIVAMHSNQSNPRIEIVIDTGNTGTGNRWGSYSLVGGTDHITSYSGIEVVQYTTSSTGTRQFTS